jgi:hypothetical protein
LAIALNVELASQLALRFKCYHPVVEEGSPTSVGTDFLRAAGALGILGRGTPRSDLSGLMQWPFHRL